MRRVLIALVAVFAVCGVVLAEEWPQMHSQADALSLEQARAAFQVHPEVFGTAYMYGLKCLDAHDNSALQAVIERLQQQGAQRKETRWLEAEVLRRRHEYPRSEALLQDILKEDKDFAPAALTLANMRYSQKRFAECLELSEHVVSRGRERVDLPNYVRALALVAGGKGGLANQGGLVAKLVHGLRVKSYLTQAESLKPDSLPVLIGLGAFYVLAPPKIGGNPDKAITYLEKAIKVDPLSAAAYARLAQAYLQKGNKEAYRAQLQKALEIEPLNEIALELKAEEASSTGEKQKK